MPFNIKSPANRCSLVITLTLCSQAAMASGFQINEYSATGLGRAFAGDGAITDNASVNAKNPAAIVLLDKTSISMGTTYIDPDVNIDIKSSTLGSKDTGMLNDGADSEIVPNLHITTPINDRFFIGYSLTATFGLSTDYGSDIAGTVAGSTELTVINHNLNGAYKINDAWSIGLGVDYATADASLMRYYNSATVADVDGSGDGVGWNAGILYQYNAKNRFAFTYRSEIDLHFTGSFTGIYDSTKYASNADATLDIKLPEIFEFSAFHQVLDQLAIHYSITRTNWSSFKTLTVSSADSSSDYINKTENWHDTWRLAIGTTYTLNPQWALRAGFAFDESPVDNNNRTISIPDTDRYWWTLGATYRATEDLSFDFGFAYLSGKEYDSSTETDDLGTTYTYNSTGDAYLYALQASYSF